MLKLNNITKSFLGIFEPVLKNINLTIEAGEFCVIIGANGSGKSTLMKIISGEYSNYTGNVIIDGADQSNKNSSYFIAQVIQDVNKGTISEMTLLENIALSQMRSGFTKIAFYNRLKAMIIQKLKVFEGLENYINQPLANLSGGQRQMVATIMAISSNPKILLLDEHTSALDPKMQQILMNYTANAIAESKLTSLMITHRLDDAIKYGNRLVMLHRGQIVLDITGAAKFSLTINELLKLFHQYEDLSLIGGT